LITLTAVVVCDVEPAPHPAVATKAPLAMAALRPDRTLIS
jgi:hypothetical protein